MKKAIILLLACSMIGNSLLMSACLTIRQAELTALENNNDIKTLRHLLDKAKQGKLENFSRWFPQIALVSQGYKTQKPDLFTKTRSVFLTQFYLTQALKDRKNKEVSPPFPRERWGDLLVFLLAPIVFPILRSLVSGR